EWNPRSSARLDDSSTTACLSTDAAVARNVYSYAVCHESSESSGYIVFRFPICRRSEKSLGLAELYQTAVQKKAGFIGHARSLLHIVRHDDDGVVALELIDQFFDLRRRNRIQC